jgi:hypothetical protein
MAKQGECGDGLEVKRGLCGSRTLLQSSGSASCNADEEASYDRSLCGNRSFLSGALSLELHAKTRHSEPGKRFPGSRRAETPFFQEEFPSGEDRRARDEQICMTCGQIGRLSNITYVSF